MKESVVKEIVVPLVVVLVYSHNVKPEQKFARLRPSVTVFEAADVIGG